MPPVSEERQQLLADIQYFESLIDAEKKTIKTAISQRINGNHSIDEQMDVISDEVAKSLATITARMAVIEKVLSNEYGLTLPEVKPQQSEEIAATKPIELTDSLNLSAEQLGENANFHNLENSNGVNCRWTGPNSVTHIDLPVTRQQDCEVMIAIVASIKPEFIQNLKLRIDEQHIPFSPSYRKGTNYVRLQLPKQETSHCTRLSIELPATYSPHELGISHDTRKLGIAISEIQAYPRQNLAKRALKRLSLTE